MSSSRGRALVYNPGLHVLGGGERYTFALADALSETWDVQLAGTGAPDVDDLARLGFPTNWNIAALPYRAFPEVSRDYDLAVTVAIVPPSYPSHAHRSVLVVQFPFRVPIGWRHPRAALRERTALRSYDRFVSYSAFGRRWLRKRWHKDSVVVHPPVSTGSYVRARKEKIILSIARFIPPKGQAVLVDAFTTLPIAIRESWTLVLVGGSTDSVEEIDHLRDLDARARGHRIEVIPNAPQTRVDDLLDRASLFWHGAGSHRRPDAPQDAEHFGIAVVEAMSRGAVPLVFADGGPTEFVTTSNGGLWYTPSELVAQTIALMHDERELEARARQGVNDARAFTMAAFRSNVRALVSEVAYRRS